MKNTQSNSPLFWYAFIGIIILLALIAISAGIRGSLALLEEPPAEPQPVVEILLGGTARYLRPEHADQLAPRIQAALDTQQTATLTWMDAQIDTEIDRIFAEAQANVPNFTTWYYTLQGEYARYASALVGNMQEFLAGQIRERIFAEARLAENLDQALATLNTQTATQFQHDAQQLQGVVETFLASHAVENTPATDMASQPLTIEGEVQLGSAFTEHFAITDHDIERQVINGLVATGVGAAVSKGVGTVIVNKIVAKVMGTKTFQVAAALLAKFAAKMAVKSGSAVGAAATGTTVCSVAGPVALACGAVAGVATWLLVDKAFIEFDEALHREAFEAELRQAIAEEQEGLKTQLKTTYSTVIIAQYAQISAAMSQTLTQQLKQDFVPAQSLPATSD